MRPFRSAILLAAMSVVTGCSWLGLGGDPMDDVELLSDVTLAPDAEPAALVAPAEQTSILGDFLAIFSRDDAVEVTPAAVVTSEELGVSDDVAALEDFQTPEMIIGNIAEVGASAIVDVPETQDVAVVATPDVPEPSEGVMGFLTGLLPEANDEPPATAVPFVPPAFGEVAANCAVSGAALGTQIAEASGYTIYDTQPGSTELRAHYIMGMNDRCARRFDAALVLLGDIGTHELVRYSKTRVNLDYSATDEAYETIKASYCGAARGAPCGDRLDRLSRDTTFVTAYKTFGASPTWAEFLLHDGDVAAVDIEG